jgi:hypothetical protein
MNDESLEKRRWPEARQVSREESTGDPLAQLKQDHLAGQAEIDKAKGVNPAPEPEFVDKLAALINSVSRENRSNTPDFVLAKFMETCLFAFENASNTRERWFGKYLNILGENKPADRRPVIKIPKMEDVNTRTPEGYLFNAAMAILTVEYQPGMSYPAMYNKVSALAVKILEGEAGRDERELSFDYNSQPPTTAKAEILREFRFEDIDTKTREGRYLIGAIAKLMADLHRDLHPNAVMELLKIYADAAFENNKPKFNNAGNRNEKPV